MKTGWIQDEKGRWFYLETAADQGGVEGRLHTGWLKDPSGNWYFMNTVPGSDFGAMLTGWQWIDNSCYYFGTDAATNIGKLYMNTTTPDGYKVNADGRWVNADGSIRHDQKGIASAVKADGTPIEKESSTSSSDSESSSSSSGGSHSSGNGGSSNGGNGSSNNGGSSNGGSSDNSGSNNNGGNNGNNGSDNNGGSNGNNGSDNNGGSNGNNGSDNNGGDNGNNGSDDKNDDTTVSVVDENKTKIMNVASLGKWLTITFDEGYNADNCNVTVDGKDVTESLTKVTDDGSIAKLPLIGTPGTVTAVSKEDSKKSESVVLNAKADGDSVYTGHGYLPEKILGHGAIPIWDYYLTNYDKEGDVRTHLEKSTITLGETKEEHPGYSPDAVIDFSDSWNPVGSVEIMFNYNSDEDKAWFDGISSLELLAYNNRYDSWNSDLNFTVEKDVDHGQQGNKVGVITIPFNQTNFTSNGRYYVRVHSNNGSSSIVGIHVVSSVEPTIKLGEEAVSGQNLHFEIENMTYGITDPIEQVTLKDPSGNTQVLNRIDDWYLFGNTFVLYNDETVENGRNNLPYKGSYTLTIYSNGFKTVSKTFTVDNGAEVPAAAKVSALSVDAVSRATSSGSSSSSGSSGGSTNTSADLIFDTDLLVNANILNSLGETNSAVTGIIDYWYMLSGKDSVYDNGDIEYCTWIDYIDAVNEAKNKKQTLIFADYKESGEKNPNHPYAVKEVLDDGLLGDVQHSDTYGRLPAGKVTADAVSEGSDLVLKFEDSDYFNKVTALYINGNWKELSSDQYTKNETEKTITISKDALSVGKVSVTIDASGYRSQTVEVDYNKVVETGLSLVPNYPDNATSFVVGDDGKATVSFTVKNSEGDFLKHLSYNESVLLDNEKKVLPKGQEGNTAVYYVVNNNVITLYNVTPGTHTITLQAKSEYYPDALSAEFKVDSKVLTAPEVAGVQYVTNMFSGNSYVISFTEQNNYTETYLTAVKNNGSVLVNGHKYSSSFLADDYKFSIEEFYSLKLTPEGFNEDADNTIEITVDGYTPLSFTVDTNGDIISGDDSSQELEPPAVKTVTAKSFMQKYYQISFVHNNTKAEKDAIATYLNTLKTSGTVLVNDETYDPADPSDYFWSSANTFNVSEDGYTYYILLDLSASGFSTDDNTVVSISVDGYKDLIFVVDKNGKLANTTSSSLNIDTTTNSITSVINIPEVLPSDNDIIDADEDEPNNADTVSKDVISNNVISTDDNEESNDSVISDTVDSTVDETESEDSESEKIAEIEAASDSEEKASELSADEQ